MLRRFSINFAIFFALVDACVVLLMLHLSSVIRPLLNDLNVFAEIPGPISLPLALYVLFPLCWVGILASFAVYDGRRYLRAADEFTALSLSSVLAAIALAGILYLSYREVSRAQYLLFVICVYITILAWRVIARLGFRVWRQHASEVQRCVLIVGTGPLGQMARERLTRESSADLALIGFVDDGKADGFPGELLGGISQLRGIVEKLHATDVIVALPPHFYEQIRAAVSSLSENPVRVWIALGFYDLALYRTVTEDLAGLPLLDLRASALDEYERAIKRLFDVVLGTLALIILAPLWAVAAIAVGLQDGSPTLFRQLRVGENGRLFEMLKIRTMVKNAEAMWNDTVRQDEEGAPIHKLRNDPRVTPVGRMLRRFSIDEIPQLVNVLKGEMSLVGPRPELPQLVKQYEPWQRQRLAVPPGLTGWWQVTGRSDKAMHRHTEDDMYYVRNYSIWLDIQIIIRTLWVVLLGRGAY
jgi:exopolysaccharide biosynthesis polyprenyl glycosylphosphotransferase